MGSSPRKVVLAIRSGLLQMLRDGCFYNGEGTREDVRTIMEIIKWFLAEAVAPPRILSQTHGRDRNWMGNCVEQPRTFAFFY